MGDVGRCLFFAAEGRCSCPRAAAIRLVMGCNSLGSFDSSMGSRKSFSETLLTASERRLSGDKLS